MATIRFLSLVWTYIFFLVCDKHGASASSFCLEIFSENSFALLCPAYRGVLPPSNSVQTGKKYTKLQVETATFTFGNAFLSRENFTSLQSLTYLRIVSAGIESIKPNAFVDLKSLQHLDLSKNRLTFIEPLTFRGLKLTKLILSGNPGLQLPVNAFAGASIFNFAARDCEIRSIAFKLFEKTQTKHINLANNYIQTLSAEFASIIRSESEIGGMGKEGVWGSIDLTNNTLLCDCNLLWLSQIMETQRRVIEDRVLYGDALMQFGNGPRSLRNTRTTPASGDNFSTVEEKTKPMYQMNITCNVPRWLVKRRFPLPSEFDCPAPRVIGIDIAMLGKSLNTIQLTCHARGRPTPNVAWAFRQHNQEVHRIVKSPDRTHDMWTEADAQFEESNISDGNKAVSIGLNVSLNEFKTRDFSCITWSDSTDISTGIIPSSSSSASSVVASSHEGRDPTRQLHNLLSSENTQVVPQGFMMSNRAHRVFVRLRGLQMDPTDMALDSGWNLPATNTPDNRSLADSSMERETGNLSPYQQLFVKRFTPLDLIGAVGGTCAATLFLLCLYTKCVPVCCGARRRYKASQNKSAYLLGQPISKNSSEYVGKQIVTSPGQLSKQSETSRQVELNQSMVNDEVSRTLELQTQRSLGMGDTSAMPTYLGAGPAYWPVQDYTYSPNTSHEYDVPGSLNALARAMPMAPRFDTCMSAQPSGTLLRRGQLTRGPSGFGLSTSETPQLPPVAAVPQLMTHMGSPTAMLLGQPSPFMNCLPQAHNRAQSQIIASSPYLGTQAHGCPFNYTHVMLTPDVIHGGGIGATSQLYSNHIFSTHGCDPLSAFQPISAPNSHQTTPQKNYSINAATVGAGQTTDQDVISSQTEFISEKSDLGAGRYDDEDDAGVSSEDPSDGQFIGAGGNGDWRDAEAKQVGSVPKPRGVPLANSEY